MNGKNIFSLSSKLQTNMHMFTVVEEKVSKYYQNLEDMRDFLTLCPYS